MKDEVEESVVDDLLVRYLEIERQEISELEGKARATFQQLVEAAEGPKAMNASHLLKRLIAATEDRPGVLANALGYREIQNDAEPPPR